MGLDSRDYYRPSGLGGFSFFPPVLKNLIIINIAVFFVQLIFENISFGGVPGVYLFNHYLALNPISGSDGLGLPNNFQIWQLITYQFMHANFTHILFNMFALWMFGMEIENMMGSREIPDLLPCLRCWGWIASNITFPFFLYSNGPDNRRFRSCIRSYDSLWNAVPRQVYISLFFNSNQGKISYCHPCHI